MSLNKPENLNWIETAHSESSHACVLQRLQPCANPLARLIGAFTGAGGENQDMGTFQLVRCERGQCAAQTIEFGVLRELVGLVE